MIAHQFLVIRIDYQSSLSNFHQVSGSSQHTKRGSFKTKRWFALSIYFYKLNVNFKLSTLKITIINFTKPLNYFRKQRSVKCQYYEAPPNQTLKSYNKSAVTCFNLIKTFFDYLVTTWCLLFPTLLCTSVHMWIL